MADIEDPRITRAREFIRSQHAQYARETARDLLAVIEERDLMLKRQAMEYLALDGQANDLQAKVARVRALATVRDPFKGWTESDHGHDAAMGFVLAALDETTS